MSEFIFVYDVHTTGIPIWNLPSENESQPHIVQLAAAVFDITNHKIIQEINTIIKPDGWEIPDEAANVHGISNEMAHEIGISERLALVLFMRLWNGMDRISHGSTFDNRIIRIGLKRYCISNEDAWKNSNYFCTGAISKPIMAESLGIDYGRKMPLLSDALEFFTGNELQTVKQAMPNMMACAKIYFGILELDKRENADV